MTFEEHQVKIKNIINDMNQALILASKDGYSIKLGTVDPDTTTDSKFIYVYMTKRIQ